MAAKVGQTDVTGLPLILRWFKKNSFTIISLFPIVVFFSIYVYFPALYSFYLSLFKTKLMKPVEFIGFQNYLFVLQDSYFWVAVRNTLYFTGSSLIGVLIVGLGLALILDDKIKFKTLFRSVFFMPYIIPYSALVLIWFWLLDPVYGLINYLLSFIGVKAIPWLTTTQWVMPSFIMINIWKRMGYTMVLFLAGLQTIPDELYDAAIVDGANWWCKFRHVTLPLLKPITLFVVTITLISDFQLFIEPYVMTQGGPSNASLSIVYLLYQTAFSSYNMGEASAIAVLLFILISLFTFFLMKFFKIETIYK